MSNWFGGGGTQPSGTQTSRVELSNQQDRLLDLIMPALSQYARSPPTLPSRDMIAPESRYTGNAQDLALRAAQQQAGVNRDALRLYDDLGSMLRPQDNPLLQTGRQYDQAEDLLLGGLLRPRNNEMLNVGGQAFDTAGRELLTQRNGPVTLDDASRRFQRTEDFLLGDVLRPDSNPYFRQALQAATRPITEQFQREVLPSLRGEAITAGQFGSSRQGIAEGLAAGEAQKAMGDIAARMGSDAYNTGVQAAGQAYGQRLGEMGASERAELAAQGDAYRAMLGARSGAFGQAVDALSRAYDTRSGLLESGTRMGADAALRALALTPQLLSGLTAPAQTVGAVGQQVDARRQQLLDQDVYRRMYSQQAPFMAAQEIAAIINGLPGGTAINRGFTPTGQQNPLSTGLGLASSAAGLAGLLFPPMALPSLGAQIALGGGSGGFY